MRNQAFWNPASVTMITLAFGFTASERVLRKACCIFAFCCFPKELSNSAMESNVHSKSGWRGVRDLSAGYPLESNLGRSFSSFPAWAEYLIADSFESSRTFESDGGGGRITQRCALRPSGRCLRPRSLVGARVEPWSKLLILPPLGQNI